MADHRAEARANGTHQPISRVHRRLGAAFLTALLTSTALTWPAGPAQADCGPVPTTAGDNVVCDADDADGFDYGVAPPPPAPPHVPIGSFTIDPGVTVSDGISISGDSRVINDFINNGTVEVGPSTNAVVVNSIGGNFLNAKDARIIGTKTGVSISNTLSGNFTNRGTITGGAGSPSIGTGVYIFDLTGEFINEGQITGRMRNGVQLDTGASAFSNRTDATIKGTTGVEISGNAGVFSNAGLIEGTSGYGVAISNGADTFTNKKGGEIISRAAGIAVDIKGDLNAFTNDGTITGLAGNGVTLQGTLSGQFINTGMITGASGNGVSIENITGEFINDGTIKGPTGVDLSRSPSGVTLINSGTIEGTSGGLIAIWLGTQSDTLTLIPGFQIIGDVLAGSDKGGETNTLRFGGTGGQDGTFNLDRINDSRDGEQYQGFSKFEVTGGNWTFSGDTTSPFDISGGTLKGTGTFGALTFTGGMFAPGNSIGTTTVNGALDLGAGSTLQIEVNDAGGSDLVIVNGGVTINGATLQVVELPGTYSNGPFSYTIIENDGTDPVVGSGFGAITNDFAFLTPTVNLAGGDGNDVVLTLTPIATTTVNGQTVVDLTVAAYTYNQTSAAKGLNGLSTAAGSDGATVRQALIGLSLAEARAAFDSTSGEIHASVANVLLTQGGLIAGTVGNRLAGLRAGEGPIRPVESPMALAALSFNPKEASEAMLLGMAHDDGSLKDAGSKSFVPDDLRYEAWGRAWGSTGTFDDDGNAAETDGEGAGLMAGGDVGLWAGTRFGLAGGYSSTRTEVDARASRLDADSATVLAYLTHVSGAWHAHVIGGYTHHDFDGRRNIQIGTLSRTAASDYDGHQVTVTAEVGYTHEVAGIALQPIAALRYGSLKTDGFTETGANSLNLTSRGDTNQATDTVLGLRMSTVWHAGDAILVPQLRVAWTHTFGEVTPDLGLAFAGGGVFNVIGVTRDRDAVALGAGLNAVMGESTTAYIDYAATLSDDQDAHALSGGFRVRF